MCSINLLVKWIAIYACFATASPTDAKFRKTHGGKTALFLAVEKSLLENASYLLDNGSSVDCQDNDENSSLVVGQ